MFLTTRQLQAALTDLGFQPLGQAHNEVFQLCHAQRLPDLLLARSGFAVSDVVANAVVEQHGILRHHTYGLTQAVLGYTTDILSVDADCPGRHVVETEQQTRQG